MSNKIDTKALQKIITKAPLDQLIGSKNTIEQEINNPETSEEELPLKRLMLLIDTEIRLRKNNMPRANCKHHNNDEKICDITNEPCAVTSTNDPILCCQMRAEQVIEQYNSSPATNDDAAANEELWGNIHAISEDYIKNLLSYSLIDIKLEDYDTSQTMLADAVLNSALDMLATSGVDVERAYPTGEKKLYIITNTTSTGQYTPSKAESFAEAQDFMFRTTVTNYLCAYPEDLNTFCDDKPVHCEDYDDLVKYSLITQFLDWAVEQGRLEYSCKSAIVYYSDDTFNDMHIYDVDEI